MSRQMSPGFGKLPRLVVVAVLLAFAVTGAAPVIGQSSPANGVATNVMVSGIGMSSTAGNMVFIEISANKTGNPSCSTNGPGQWSFVLPLTSTIQQQMLTTLMAARTAIYSPTTVTLVGSGLCDTYSTVETLTNVIF
jgi:hypothetical protein